MTEDLQRQLQQTRGRIDEMLGCVPIPFGACQESPVFLQDLYINFKRYVWLDGMLSRKEKVAIGYAVSFFLRCGPWRRYFFSEMQRQGFTADDDIRQVEAVVSTCAAFNTFFGFTQLAGSPFGGMSVGLRGHSLQAPGLTPLLVEVIALAISTLNSCQTCVKGHLAEARGRGASDEMILEAIQCAGTITAGCTFLASHS